MKSNYLSKNLKTELQNRREILETSFHDKGLHFPADPNFISELEQVLLYSEFAASALSTDPELLVDLIKTGSLDKKQDRNHPVRLIRDKIKAIREARELKALLFRIRQREMVRIAWRDLTCKAELEETLTDLSFLAETCVKTAVSFLYDHLSSSYGIPVDTQHGLKQHLIVLAMGKLGAGELNFSSDIDLIFVYTDEGETSEKEKIISNNEFFTLLARKFIALFDMNQDAKLLFRVDTRLRPFGDSGPLVMSCQAMETYYQTQGREWERYALIKAKPIAGDIKAGHLFLKKLNPFIYRRYFDYGAYDSFRDMKKRISLQVKNKKLKNNIKLGSGGIREVEFFAQMFQLIRGGIEIGFQEPNLLKVLDILAAKSCINVQTKKELSGAYIFLRRIENRLQAYGDLQTHELPKNDDAKLRLALSMGFNSWGNFFKIYHHHTSRVHEHFNQLLDSEEETKDEKTDSLKQLWGTINDPQAQDNSLTLPGFQNPDRIIGLLKSLSEHSNTTNLTTQGRKRLDRLVPLLVKTAWEQPDAHLVLSRLVDLVTAIERRTCYISLMLENSGVLDTLADLAQQSPWIISFLSNHPALLDELLDPATLYAPPDKPKLKKELLRRVANIPCDDIELQLEDLCIFKQINTLKVAAADISGNYPLMKVSDHLTWIAETILDRVIAIAWRQVTKKYGSPSRFGCNAKNSPGFAAVAYGKMGGIELGYKSDLDLVFIHSGDSGLTRDGKTRIENVRFYILLGQRIINMLTLHTAAGTLYEADMRLRPSGQSGMIVSHIDAFKEYIHNQAWTWEHQAIIRARPVSGDPSLQNSFNEIRKTVLRRRRDPDRLKKEVGEMRKKMMEQQAKPETGSFDLKQGKGGIVDIEFLVQYLVLKECHTHKNLAIWTDNVRLLETLASETILSDSEASTLKEAYLLLRKTVHRLNLQEKTQTAAAEDFFKTGKKVFSIVERYLYN